MQRQRRPKASRASRPGNQRLVQLLVANMPICQCGSLAWRSRARVLWSKAFAPLLDIPCQPAWPAVPLGLRSAGTCGCGRAATHLHSNCCCVAVIWESRERGGGIAKIWY